MVPEKRVGLRRRRTHHGEHKTRKMEGGGSSRAKRVIRSLLASLYYIGVSVSLTLFNKILFQRYDSASPVLVLLSQCILTLVMLNVLGVMGVRATLPVRTLTKAQLKTHAPLAASYILMLLFGLAALRHTSLLMYHTLRRAGIVVVLVLRFALDGTTPSKSTVAAALLIVSGALTAVAHNLRWEPTSYALALSANLCAAFYLLRLKRVRDALSLSNLELLFLNNLVAFPVLLLTFIANPPDTTVWRLFRVPEFTALFLCSSSLALVLNHSTYVDTTVNDAVAHVVSAQIKDVILLVLSVLFIDNPELRSAGMLRGALIAVFGSAVYAGGKIVDITKEPTKQAAIKEQELKRALIAAEEDENVQQR